MDRRLIGALLVVMVLTVAIVVPARNGLRMAGSGSIGELPADPVVGDCLLQPAYEFWAEGAGGGVPAEGVQRARKNPLAPIFGPCDGGEVAGEVVAVTSASGTGVARQARAEASGLDCRSTALQYAGLFPLADRFVVADQLSVDPVSWQLSVSLRGSWMLPSVVMQAAGRSWAACVATPGVPGFYRGSVADAYRGGRLPDMFGTCWDRAEPSAGMRAVNCGTSHAAELISVGDVPDRAATTNAAIKAACQRLSAQVMGRADPTAGGGLQVKVAPDLPDNELQRISPQEDARGLNVVCFMTAGDRSLTGSLVGIGENPIPYGS
ncbi:MAG: hypothetical protein ABWZ98_00805 [Nakamurella sp.]